MLKQFKLTKPAEIKAQLDKLEADLTGSKELILFVRAHLAMTRMVLDPKNAKFFKTTKPRIKKALRSLQLEIDTAQMLGVPCDFANTTNFEFTELFKQIVAPYQGLLDARVIQYLAEKLEIESELHTTAYSQTEEKEESKDSIKKRPSKKRKNPFNKESKQQDDLLSVRSKQSKISAESVASLFDAEPRRPSKILKIRRMNVSGAIKMSQNTQAKKEKLVIKFKSKLNGMSAT